MTMMVTTVTANFTEANPSTTDAVKAFLGVLNLLVALPMAQPAV
jgi:hypothetical protein